MSDTCPSCPGPLHAGKVGDVPVQRCARCSGVLVEMDQLVDLLDVVAADLLKRIDPDLPIEPFPDRPGRVACPVCGKVMHTFGYLGTTLVRVDRCERDGLLWLDPDELGAMALVHARTRRRLANRDRAARNRHATAVRLTARALVNQAMAGMFERNYHASLEKLEGI